MPISEAECSITPQTFLCNNLKLSDGIPVEKRVTVRLKHGTFTILFKVIHLHLVLVFTTSEVTCTAG